MHKVRPAREIHRISLESLLSEWRVFCEKHPKGFEKYFKSKEKTAGATTSESKGEGKDAAKKDAKSPEKSSSSSSTPPAKENDWNFGMFSPNSSKSGGSRGSSSSGKPLGGEDNDKEKWLMFGAAVAVAIAGSIIYFEVGYKEIGWKEFVTKYGTTMPFVDMPLVILIRCLYSFMQLPQSWCCREIRSC